MLGVSAVGGNGSLSRHWTRASSRSDDMIAGLQAALRRYRTTDRGRARRGLDVKTLAPRVGAALAPGRRLRRARSPADPAPVPDRFGAPDSPSRDTRRRREVAAAVRRADRRSAPGAGARAEPGRLDALPTGVQPASWEGPGLHQDVSASPSTPTRDFLVDTYRSRRCTSVFEPTMIAGFPAVAAADARLGARSCTITTGDRASDRPVDVSCTRLESGVGANDLLRERRGGSSRRSSPYLPSSPK